MELLNKIWDAVDVFVVGYLVVLSAVALLVIGIIVVTVIQIVRGNREFKQMKNRRLKRGGRDDV